MNAQALLEPLIARNIEAPGDYVGEDGLLRCGKCGGMKQCRMEYGPLAGRLLPIACDCVSREEEREKRRAREREIARLREDCLPAVSMRAHTFAAAGEAGHIRTARRYAEKWDEVRAKNLGLLLWGNTGTGKTFTAHCVANALIDRGVAVALFSAAELVSRLADKNERGETLRRVRHTPLLILDDFGAERDTAYANELLCTAIDARGEAEMPLLVTTNYTLDELRSGRDAAKQRMFDRLLALCVPVAVRGESRRRAAAEQKLNEARTLLREEKTEN